MRKFWPRVIMITAGLMAVIACGWVGLKAGDPALPPVVKS